MSTKTTVKKGVHFVKEVMARIEGDADKVIAEKNARLAVAALTAQTAALTGAIVKQEMAVEVAEEDLGNAQYPTSVIADAQVYCDNITFYQNKLDDANNSLDDLRASQESFEKLLEAL